MNVIIPKNISNSTFTRASPASYYNNIGRLVFATNNVFRTEYDPANLAAQPYPVLEGTLAASQVTFSEDISRSATATGLNVARNATKAPDDTYTANCYIEDSSNSTHSLSFPSYTITGEQGVFSVFAKARERNSIYLRVSTGGLEQTIVFDISAGTYSTISNTFPVSGVGTIRNVGKGWYRCSISVSSGVISITSGIYNGSTSYVGVNLSGVYLWGAQFEEVRGAPTSYSPSTQTFISNSGAQRYVTGPTGLLVLPAANTARMEYTADNLTLPPKLLLEPTVTNLLLNSSNYTSAPWTLFQTTQNTFSFPTPAGNSIFSYTSNSSFLGYISNTISVPNDSLMRVFSVYIRKTTNATWAGISMLYAGGTLASAALSINTFNGAVNGSSAFGTAAYSSVKSLPNHWRLTIGIPNNLTGNNSLQVRMYPTVNNNGSDNWTGGATSNGAQFWGAQLEEGYSETSHVPTNVANPPAGMDVASSVAGARSADVNTFGLIFTNIPENDFPAWSPTATYNVDVAGNNSVVYNHVKYASLQSTNMGRQPDISPAWWSVIDATNAYAMFDGKVITQTVGAVGGHIVVYMDMNNSNISFLNVVADNITVKVYSEYQQVYSNVVDFSGGSSGVPVSDYTISGIPATPTGNTYAIVDIYSATSAPAIGNLIIGDNYYAGSTETNPTIGITDYSVKNVDGFGNPTLTKRGFAKRMSTKQLLDDSEVDKVARLMSMVRATPCVWNANTTIRNPNNNSKTSLIVYGYYKDWEITASINKSYLTLTIEGLV